MDLENLTKTQIILLTLLVSFVTSIATAIATVSLVEQAPADVTRVIDRIVERPAETIRKDQKEVITQERTIVVKEAELIAQAVAKVTPSIVRIYSGRNGDFKGITVIADKDGTLLTHLPLVSGDKAILYNGLESIVTRSETDQKLWALHKEDKTLSEITPAVLGGSDLKLGQTVIAIGGNTENAISPGNISQISPNSSQSGSSESSFLLNTTVDVSIVMPGSVLINLDGHIIGEAASREDGTFITVGSFKEI